MKSTTWIKVASLSALCTAAISAPALAGSSYVENDYSIRNVFNGRSRTDVKIDSQYDFQRSASSNASKVGTTRTETNQSSRGDVDGFWTEQSFNEVDNFDIASYSNASETGSGWRTEKIRVNDSYSYNGIDKTHRVTSGFDF